MSIRAIQVLTFASPGRRMFRLFHTDCTDCGERVEDHMPNKPDYVGTEADRFWDRIEVNEQTGCWEWRGGKSSNGYGLLTLSVATRRTASGNAAMRGAHIWSYERYVGPVPDGLELDHLCRTPICCNPSHLEPVTHLENMRRSITATAKRCRRGHDAWRVCTWSGKTFRVCIECVRLKNARRKNKSR
jgi:hypothetical protein